LYCASASNSRIHKAGFVCDAQVIQNKRQHERSANCYPEGASDVPAAGKYPGQPKEQQDPARATANEAAPTKGKTGRKNLQKARWI
jgi:hypothetical protein